MNTRKTRTKRAKTNQDDYVQDFKDSDSSQNEHDEEDQDELRKSRIRDCNKEFARRMTILSTWSNHWTDYTTRDGEAYPKKVAREMIRKTKKITCPIENCRKQFISIGGLKYHYARCNIERCFKCTVCSPPKQLSTRGELLKHLILNHYDQLPALNEDQKEIVGGYLNIESKYDKSRKDKRATGDTEPILTGSRLIKAYKDLQSRVYLSGNFIHRPFKDWQTTSEDWELIISEYDRRRYYPPENESVRFRSSTKDDWLVAKTGESIVLNRDERGDVTSSILYTGGIVTASSWLPKSCCDSQSSSTPEIIALAVSCGSMEQSQAYKDHHIGRGCVQFWTLDCQKNVLKENGSIGMQGKLSYMVAHDYGTVLDMVWCPLGTSWQPPINTGNALSRVGLLALACGDGQVRIISVPYTNSLLARVVAKISDNTLESTPMFKVKTMATLNPPGIGSSTDYQQAACKSICWCLENNQRLIIAGYANGYVALFDLANTSPILYTNSGHRHIFRPLKSWVAHGAPVTGVAILSESLERTFIATGSTDRQVKLWNYLDLDSCMISDKAPITKLLWDFRFRGVMTATDSAFTSFSNRVSYRYPVSDGSHNVTISSHRSTVWGLASSQLTHSIATTDAAGEVFIMPQMINRSMHKRERNYLSIHSLYSMVPHPLNEKDKEEERNNIIIFSSEIPELEEHQEITEQYSESEGHLELNADFSIAERPVANRPTKFLLPLEHRPVETYSNFRSNFGLEFTDYNSTTNEPNSNAPESCNRAGDIKNIYCDRPCDYPFSSINNVIWSPNEDTFQYLLTSSHVGLCRLDKLDLIEKIYRNHVDSILHQCKEDIKQ